MKILKNKFILIITTTIVLLISCTNKQNTTSVKDVDAKNLDVKISAAVLQNVEQIAEFTGTIEAFHPSDITPSLPVRISKILVEVGDKVVKGQLLVVMDETQRKQQQLQLENLKLDYDRVVALNNAGGASQQQVDQVKTQLDIMKATVANLSENVELRSPIDGIVTDRLYNQGELFSAATGKPCILKVQDLSPLKIKINVSSEYFPLVKKGMSVNIFADVYKNEKFTGSINLIYPTIDAITRTFVVEISVPNRDLRLRPGMFSRVAINFGTQKNIVIDDMAIVRQVGTNDKYVFIEKDAVVSKVKVITGRQLDKKIEIKSDNIKDGDNVVVAGQTKLLDGSKVSVKE